MNYTNISHIFSVKLLANEDTLLLMMFLGLRKRGNICFSNNVSSFARAFTLQIQLFIIHLRRRHCTCITVIRLPVNQVMEGSNHRDGNKETKHQ